MKTKKIIKEVLSPHWRILLIILLLVFLIEIISLLIPYLVGGLLDKLRGDVGSKLMLSIIFVSLSLFTNIIVQYIKTLIEIRWYIYPISRSFDLLSIKNILNFSIGQLKKDNSGEIQSVIQTGINNFSEYIKIVLFDLIPMVVYTIVAIIWLSLLSVEIALITGVFSIVIALFMYYINKTRIEEFTKTRTMWQKLDSFRVEIFRNASRIKFGNREEKVIGQFKRRYLSVEERDVKNWSGYIRMVYLAELTQVTLMISILYFGSQQVMNGTYTLGTFVIIYSWVSNILARSTRLRFSFRRILKVQPGIKKYLELISKNSREQNGGSINHISYGSIEFKNVSFSYEEGDEVHALKNVSFSIAPGESLAIVGFSGSGKSTLVNLLMNAYKVNSGGIYIDGMPLDQYSKQYRKDIGYVEQKPKFFDQSIKRNLVFELHEKVDEKILYDVLNSVGLMEMVTGLPNGIQSTIGENGNKFSGGELQRLSIANVLLRKPKIFIFDEATSALDELSQKKINEAIKSVGQEATTIIIAHRLSTIKHCDKVLVLDGGTVEFFGSYNKAKKDSGIFKKMLEESSIHTT